MRWVVMAAVLGTAGCAQQPNQPPLTASERRIIENESRPEVRARIEAAREEGRRQYEQIRAQRTPDQVAAEEQGERNRQAAVICRERGNMAAAQPAYGGRGLAGSINAGLQQGWAGSEVEAACLRAYSATGVVPSY